MAFSKLNEHSACMPGPVSSWQMIILIGNNCPRSHTGESEPWECKRRRSFLSHSQKVLIRAECIYLPLPWWKKEKDGRARRIFFAIEEEIARCSPGTARCRAIIIAPKPILLLKTSWDGEEFFSTHSCCLFWLWQIFPRRTNWKRGELASVTRHLQNMARLFKLTEHHLTLNYGGVKVCPMHQVGGPRKCIPSALWAGKKERKGELGANRWPNLTCFQQQLTFFSLYSNALRTKGAETASFKGSEIDLGKVGISPY